MITCWRWGCFGNPYSYNSDNNIPQKRHTKQTGICGASKNYIRLCQKHYYHCWYHKRQLAPSDSFRHFCWYFRECRMQNHTGRWTANPARHQRRFYKYSQQKKTETSSIAFTCTRTIISKIKTIKQPTLPMIFAQRTNHLDHKI